LRERPKLVKVTEQMKAWSAALGAELYAWNEVTAKRMFGMTMYFRKGIIFAALPLTRSFESPTSVAFKLYKKTPETLRALESDPLILRSAGNDAPKWIVLEMRDERDLASALKWFGVAYRGCLSRNNSKV
jgi:hypothetical protein